MKKIFLIGLCSDYFISIIEKLNLNKFLISDWIYDDKSDLNLLKSKFQNTNFYFFHDIIRGKIKTENKINIKYRNIFSNLDSKLLYEMFKRIDPNSNKNKVFIEKYLKDLTIMWSKFLKKKDIDILIFHRTPHMPSTYVLYLVAKKLFKKKILILEDGKYLNYCFFEKKIESLGSNFKIKKNIHKNLIIKNYLKKALSKNKINPNPVLYRKYSNNYFQLLIIFYNSFIRIFVKEGFNLFNIYKYFFVKQKTSIFNYTKLSFSDPKSFPTKFSDNFFYFSAFLKNKKIEDFYYKHCTKDLPEKYIFLVPNYMPEKSTVPDGQKYYDLFKVIEILDKIKYSNLKIVYKEHPGQFNYHRFGFLSKNIKYYKELMQKKIIFVEPNYDLNKLINRSEFVATVTSEIAINSILKNKFVLVFGKVWYQNCEGIIKYSTKINTKFLKNLILRKKIIKEKILKFLFSIEKCNVIETGNQFISFTDLNYKQLKKGIYKNNLNKNTLYFEKNIN